MVKNFHYFEIVRIQSSFFKFVTCESTEELNLAQKQNLEEIESLKKTALEQRQELIDIRTARNKIRDDLDDEKRRSIELENRLQVYLKKVFRTQIVFSSS